MSRSQKFHNLQSTVHFLASVSSQLCTYYPIPQDDAASFFASPYTFASHNITSYRKVKHISCVPQLMSLFINIPDNSLPFSMLLLLWLLSHFHLNYPGYLSVTNLLHLSNELSNASLETLNHCMQRWQFDCISRNMNENRKMWR